VRQLIIIGSGPAALTAAIYAARANLAPLVVASSVEAGGELMNTTDVENFPGFPEGIQGPELMTKIQEQAEKFGAEVIYDDVVSVDFAGPVKQVRLGSGTAHEAAAVIFATGSAYRKIGIEGEERLSGRGVSWCATCDGFFFRERTIAIVGGGDSAMEEALFLSRMASSVTIVHRRDQFRASPIMVARALANPAVHVRWNAVVEEVVGEQKVEAVRVRDTVTGELEDIPAAAMFVAIGHDPNTGLVAGQIELDDAGYVVTDGTRTSVEGVFACGDVQDTEYKQAITAAGSGCMAAMDAERWLEARGASTVETKDGRPATALASGKDA
jgi:thioredoxin reductase (NADPH)